MPVLRRGGNRDAIFVIEADFQRVEIRLLAFGPLRLPSVAADFTRAVFDRYGR